MKLKGKVALVTGAGQGIGKAIALAFAREGADVAVNARHLETSEATAEAIRALGRRAIAVPADVSKADEVDAMVHKVLEQLGKIDILVNNAGGGQKAALMLDYDMDDWDYMVAVNFRGPYLCSQRAAQWMSQHDGGKILNMASINGYIGAPLRSAYAPAKAGIMNLTKVMASELGRYKINVNCVAPGVVLTDRIKKLAEQGVFDIERVKEQTPLGTICTPEDVANAAVFLVSEEAKAITGITLPIDAGFLAYRPLN